VRCAVAGHIEWTEFALVDHVPAPGQIAHATEHWSGPAGGGSVVAVEFTGTTNSSAQPSNGTYGNNVCEKPPKLNPFNRVIIH